MGLPLLKKIMEAIIWSETPQQITAIFMLLIGCREYSKDYKWLCAAVEKSALVDLSYTHTLVKLQCKSELCTQPVTI